MFYYISGKLAKLDGAFAVIDAGGVGFKMTISKSTYYRLAGKENTDGVKLYTYMAVREDGTELFGFSSEEELKKSPLYIPERSAGAVKEFFDEIKNRRINAEYRANLQKRLTNEEYSDIIKGN